MNPENAYHWVWIKSTVRREVPEDDPEGGAARHGSGPTRSGGSTRAALASTALRDESFGERRILFELWSTRLRPSGRPELGRVAVVGGSLGGLTAGLLLADVGCGVENLRAVAATLEARGAGIAVLDPTMLCFRDGWGPSPEEYLHPHRGDALSGAGGGRAALAEHRTGSPRGTRSTGNCRPRSTPTATCSAT